MTPPPHDDRREGRYSAAARLLHWLTALLIAVQIPVGIVMSYRGNVLDLWNRTTDLLYSSHKSLGFILLVLVLIRLLARAIVRPPPPESGLPRWQMRAAAASHAGLYLLLVAVPMLGWFGVSLFPALEVFGVIALPAITGPDRAASDTVFSLHAAAAFVLLALVALHVAAALYHHLIRRDGVLRRMWG
ncbi:MAG TPA: cytochrome b/b6 domain-containing protein [Rhodopila sp.]